MANQSVGTPRFYVDFTQLLKTKGFYFWEAGLGNANDIEESLTESTNNIWNFDFYKPQEYTANDDSPDFYFWTTADKNFSRLAGIANWAGFFNHNFASSFSGTKKLKIGIRNSLGINANTTLTDVSNCDIVDKDGFSIGIFDEFGEEDIELIWLGLRQPEEYEADSLEPFTVSCASFGRYYDLPQSPDLNIKKSIEYEGVKIQRTLGGGDYVQIDNFGTPDWMSGEPWVLTSPDDSNSRVARHGRRSWQLSFSYISNDDLFFDTNRLNSFVDLEFETVGEAEQQILSAGTEIQQIFDLTMCGAFSFVFCPDKDATNPEFAQCRIDQKSLKATQIAHQCWDISMNIVEVW